jgi:hypothetical protein
LDPKPTTSSVRYTAKSYNDGAAQHPKGEGKYTVPKESNQFRIATDTKETRGHPLGTGGFTQLEESPRSGRQEFYNISYK